jgi:hypothetical protein
MSRQQWPIDFDSLTKDSVIDQCTIEHAFAIKFLDDPDAYSFKLLSLCEEIRDNRADLAGHVRVIKHEIRIMTDEEAEDWQTKRYNEDVKSINRIGHRRGSIDRSGFDPVRIAKSNSLDMSIAATVLTAQSEKRRHNRLIAATRSHQLPPKVEGEATDLSSQIPET